MSVILITDDHLDPVRTFVVQWLEKEKNERNCGRRSLLASEEVGSV